MKYFPFFVVPCVFKWVKTIEACVAFQRDKQPAILIKLNLHYDISPVFQHAQLLTHKTYFSNMLYIIWLSCRLHFLRVLKLTLEAYSSSQHHRAQGMAGAQ